MTVSSFDLAEYTRTHEKIGVYEAKSQALISVSGEDRVSFLQGMLTNDMKTLSEKKWFAAGMLNAKGRLLADLFVYHCGDEIRLSCDQQIAEKVRTTLEMYVITEDVVLKDITSECATYYCMGPHAEKTAISVAAEYSFRTDIPFAPSFVLFVSREKKIEAALLIGETTWETIRVEAGIPKYGRDVSEENLLLEIPLLERIGVSFTKGCYVGQETVARLHSRGGHIAKRLMGVVAKDPKMELSPGAKLTFGGKEVGVITSAVHSPKYQAWLGLSAIHRDAFAPGTEIQVFGSSEGSSGNVISL